MSHKIFCVNMHSESIPCKSKIQECPANCTDEDLFQARVQRVQASKDVHWKTKVWKRSYLLKEMKDMFFIYFYVSFLLVFFNYFEILLIGFPISCPYFSVNLNFPLHLFTLYLVVFSFILFLAFTLFFPRSPLRVTATDGGPLRRGSDLRLRQMHRENFEFVVFWRFGRRFFQVPKSWTLATMAETTLPSPWGRNTCRFEKVPQKPWLTV